MLCPKCGSENAPSNTYCCNCGEKLKNNTQLTKDNFPTKNKSSNSSNNNFIDNLFNDAKKFSLILTVMVCVIIINICLFVHKRNKVSTKNASTNELKKTPEIKNKKPSISKEQLNAEKKTIDDYITMISAPSYTDYFCSTLDIENKLDDNYFQSSYKKDALLLKAHAYAYCCLEDFNPENKNSRKLPKGCIYFFRDNISYINPHDTSNYHIDAKKFISKIEESAYKIFDINIEKWEDIYNDRNTLSSDKWDEKYGAPREPKIGMTMDQVLKSTWGQPKDINKTTTTYGTSEQWVYGITKYIYFEDGVVTTIQN